MIGVREERLVEVPPADSGSSDQPDESAHGSRTPELFLGALVAAVIAEFLLLRVFFRIGVYIPKREPFETIHAALVNVGTLAFNLATVIAFGFLLWLARRAATGGDRAAAAVLYLYLAGALASLVEPSLAGITRALFPAAVVALAWQAVRSRAPKHDRVAIGLVGGTLVLSAYAGLAGGIPLAVGPGSPAGASQLQFVAEVLAVTACFAFLAARMARGPLGAGAWAIGAVPALLLLAAWSTDGALTGILAMWTVGFRMFLPLWVYVVAAWALGAAIAPGRGDGSGRASALILIAASGLLLESTYAQALALIGLALLARPPALVRESNIA